MAFFPRGPDPGPLPSYRDYLPFLLSLFRRQCAYCNMVSSVWQIDHFRPQSKFPKLLNVWSNLYYCCPACNTRKGDRWPTKDLAADRFVFTDPCDHDPDILHRWTNTAFKLVPRTDAGRYTIMTIDLNRQACVVFRRRRAEARSRLLTLHALVAERGDDTARKALRLAQDAFVETWGDLPE